MNKVIFLISLCATNGAIAAEAPSNETVCFNQRDAASTGMTSQEYYKATHSSCEEQMRLAKENEVRQAAAERIANTDIRKPAGSNSAGKSSDGREVVGPLLSDGTFFCH